MIKEFRGFDMPEDSTTVWRYMDFTKFVDLLSKKSLFFVKSTKFEDPFEGLYPTKITAGNLDFHKEVAKIREFNFVNCWHINDHESAAMWNLYLKTTEGVAVKTTVSGIKSAFSSCQEEILIGKVRYWDYENGDPDELYSNAANGLGGTTINPIIYKRKSFEHENEMRLIYSKFNMHDMENPPKENGFSISADLNELIQEVYIAPYAPGWFKALVADVMKTYGLNKPSVQSNLYGNPL